MLLSLVRYCCTTASDRGRLPSIGFPRLHVEGRPCQIANMRYCRLYTLMLIIACGLHLLPTARSYLFTLVHVCELTVNTLPVNRTGLPQRLKRLLRQLSADVLPSFDTVHCDLAWAAGDGSLPRPFATHRCPATTSICSTVSEGASCAVPQSKPLPRAAPILQRRRLTIRLSSSHSPLFGCRSLQGKLAKVHAQRFACAVHAIVRHLNLLSFLHMPRQLSQV